jgi:hypothetical protein
MLIYVSVKRRLPDFSVNPFLKSLPADSEEAVASMRFSGGDASSLFLLSNIDFVVIS